MNNSEVETKDVLNNSWIGIGFWGVRFWVLGRGAIGLQSLKPATQSLSPKT